jgi:3',5'-cyclic AMP phosphodiesterase CpdA
MLTLFHISDIHCGPPCLERVAEAVVRLGPKVDPDAVIVSGDLTQRAKPEQFREARRFIERLPDVPTLVIPGNHDVPLYRVWERLTRPHQAYLDNAGATRESVLRLPGAVIVGLDSTSPRRTITRGRISKQQVDWAMEQFDSAGPDDARIIVAHHHFVHAPDALNDRSMMGGERAVRRFIEGGVDLAMGGHLHRAFIGNSLDFFFDSPRDRGMIIVQAGTATSHRGRGREQERNSLNVVRIYRSWLEITHHLYFHDEDAFSPLSHHVFTRAGHRFGDDAEGTLSVHEDLEGPSVQTRAQPGP